MLDTSELVTKHNFTQHPLFLKTSWHTPRVSTATPLFLFSGHFFCYMSSFFCSNACFFCPEVVSLFQRLCGVACASCARRGGAAPLRVRFLISGLAWAAWPDLTSPRHARPCSRADIAPLTTTLLHCEV